MTMKNRERIKRAMENQRDEYKTVDEVEQWITGVRLWLFIAAVLLFTAGSGAVIIAVFGGT